MIKFTIHKHAFFMIQYNDDYIYIYIYILAAFLH